MVAMQEKWEYCILSGVYPGIYNYPKLVFFTTEGEKVESLSGDSESSENDSVEKWIEKLGKDGWKVFEVYSTVMDGAIYFERKVT